MNQAPEFNTQFFAPSVLGVAMVAAGYQLYTWVSGGVTVAQTTYTDQGGGTPNANPIILDSDGRCNLWLNPALEYTLELRLPVAAGGAQVRVWNDVVGAAAGSNTVSSVNARTGAVTLDAAAIPYVTSAVAAWHTGTDVEGSLNQVITRLNAPPAASVTVADAGGLLVATTVEAALAELATSSLLPARASNDGKVLALVAGALAWQRRETSFALSVTDGALASRTVRLTAGTWQVVLDSRAEYLIPTTGHTATQNATVVNSALAVVATIDTSIHFHREGGAGFGYLMGNSDISVGSFVVGAEGDYTMNIAAMVLDGATPKGSRLTLEKIA